MKMAVLTGNNGVVKIDASIGGSLATVLNVRNFSVDITADTIETSTMGVDVRTYVKGMSSWSGSADIYVDTANLTGGASAIAPLIATGGTVGEATASVELYLNNTANKFSGEVIITGFSVSSSMDGLVEGTISFQGSGAVTYAAS
jgi:predicted secreted protein